MSIQDFFTTLLSMIADKLGREDIREGTGSIHWDFSDSTINIFISPKIEKGTQQEEPFLTLKTGDENDDNTI